MHVFPETYELENQTFTKIKDRSYADVAIYQNDEHILRIGTPEHLEKDLLQHQLLLDSGFRVPNILKTGRTGEYFYLLEEKFSGDHLGSQMQESCNQEGKISDELFSSLMRLIEHHADAQQKSVIEKEDAVHDPIHRKHIFIERPHLAGRIEQTLRKIDKKLETLPRVLSHGDFNPHNMFHEGFIDFEYMDHSSFGEDVINPLIHIYFFPEQPHYEYQRGYIWTKEQIEDYFSFLDSQGLLPYLNEFIFIRCIFTTVRMESTPKLQAWRYSLFERLLSAYEKEEDLFPILISFPS